jgi:hypothetical protein
MQNSDKPFSGGLHENVGKLVKRSAESVPSQLSICFSNLQDALSLDDAFLLARRASHFCETHSYMLLKHGMYTTFV